MICLDNDRSNVKRIDFLAAICDNSNINQDNKIEKMLTTVDDDNILVERKDELTVINASNQCLVAWLSTRNSHLIGYNSNFVVLLKTNDIHIFYIKLQVS